MPANIRIDQSHCNYALSCTLQNSGWDVLFRDPGRASRGRSGNQAKVHAAFVEKKLPIPDIVAHRLDEILIVEVELSYAKCRASLNTYLTQQVLIVESLNRNLDPAFQALKITLGFCKIGVEQKVDQVFSDGLVILVASFPTPTPELHWVS